MPDLLIRNIAPNLKSEIEKQAREAGRSLSDEVKHLLHVGLQRVRSENAQPPGESAYDAIRSAFADCQASDEEHAEFERILEESRKQPWRPAPEFE